ncbi:MAG: response regulator [Deltaproteobacteria bacterium]|nr:MAG: response regulator [Deltaproteobacteria bacterium]
MKKILIVDDEINVLLHLSKALRGNGVDVITTTMIEEAEYALKHTYFDLVIADIRLTGVVGREGLGLLEYVQKRSPGTKVIIITAYGSKEIESESYDKGAYYYFDKPLDLRVLNNCLKEIGIYSDVLNQTKP